MAVGVTYEGALVQHWPAATDVDGWSFTLDQAGNVTLKFEHEPLTSILGYWAVTVSAADGTFLMEFFSGQSDGSKTVTLGLPAGSYVVQVTSQSTSTALASITNVPYRLSYTQTLATTGVAFEQETGTSAATPMSADTRYTGTLASTGNNTLDIDRWSFTLAQAGMVNLNFAHDLLPTITDKWRIALKTETGTEILSFESWRDNGSLTVPVGLPAGVYLVDVSPYPSSGAATLANVPYELNYSVVSTGHFESESNDTSASATPLALNTDYSGAIQPSVLSPVTLDTDYFKLTLDYEHNLQIKLLPTSLPSAILSLTVTNLTTATQVWSGKTTSTTGINVVIKAPASNYAVSVTGYGVTPQEGVPYTLTVNDLGQAVQHTFVMGKGWNLLGNSFDTAINVADFANNITPPVVSMWKWDASKTQWQFYAPGMTATELASYAQGKGYGVLTQVGPREGFWVNASDVTSSQVFTLVPTVLGREDLKTGWNLVASGGDLDPRQLNARLGDVPPSLSADPLVAEARPSNLQTLWSWDNTNSRWYFYAPSLDQPGTGTTLQDYINNKSYVNFFATSVPKTLGLGSGFWVNK